MITTKDGKNYEFNNVGVSFTKEQILEKVKILHGDENVEFDSIQYTDSNKLLKIICKEHGLFFYETERAISAESRRYLCSNCHKKYFKSQPFIKKAKEVHGNRFDYSRLNYTHSSNKVMIRCIEHQVDFECLCGTHIRNKSHGGCPECKRVNRFLKFSKAFKDEYDYSKVNYVDPSTPVTIICKKHFKEFSQTPSYHMSSYGKCPDCVNEWKVVNFIQRANNKHCNLYDYSLIKTYSTNEKLPIICKKHGVFYQLPLSHLSCLTPCPVCGERDGHDEYDFIKKCRVVHGNRYDYSEVKYINTKTPVTIICSFHGEFRVLPQNHLHGNAGCPDCSKSRSISKGEVKWLNSLYVPLRTVIVEGLNVDGYDGDKTIYEFLGDYWHGNLDVYPSEQINGSVKKTFGELHKETFSRLNFLKSRGYNVIYIWESDWKMEKPFQTL